MTYFTREETGLRRAPIAPQLVPDRVVGLALHWPAMSRPVRGVADVQAALRNWQAFHMDTNDWSDIAYQAAIDQDGNWYELRGLGRRSAANGGTTVNEQYGALLLVLAPGEQPTPAMVATVRDFVTLHRDTFTRSRLLVGHGAIRPGGTTECPGPAVRQALAAHVFEPSPGEPAKPVPNRVQTARNKTRTAAKLLERAHRLNNRPAAAKAAKALRRILRRTPKR